MFLMRRAMIDPGVQYLTGVLQTRALPPDIKVEAAVDLSKKRTEDSEYQTQSIMQLARWENQREREEDSDSNTPLDMSVTATRYSPVPLFSGFKRERSQSPGGRSDISENMLVRLQAGLYSPLGSLQSRGWSAERSEADRDEFLQVDGCHICGMPRSEMSSYEHGEGVCNQRPISCPLCSKTFTLWSHYETHKKCHQKLKQRQYPCQSCGKVFTSASNRNMHQRIHKGVRPFQCVPCGVYFRQKAHLQKHQRTQGHIQATELYEKRKAEDMLQIKGEVAGGVMSIGTGTKELEVDSQSETRSEDSLPPADSSTPGSASPMGGDLGEEIKNVTELFKSSPKRKQGHPQYSPQQYREDSESPDQPSSGEAQVSLNIEYNSLTHGYDCRQCDFSSHDHSLMKEHVQADHLRLVADLQCKECMVTFTKPFNLKIHLRKHQTSSQFLPCEYCEQVFKVPNKLIKHMEGVHCVCPTCGEKNSDKVGLQEHMEQSHNEPKKITLLGGQLPVSPTSHIVGQLKVRPAGQLQQQGQDMDNRHAKMRKLDSLAEHIRAKQMQLATTHTATNLVNGNTDKPNPLPQFVARRRKSEMPAVRALLDKRPLDQFFRPGLENLVNQLNRMNNQPAMLKSENNNILSSLSKMTEFPRHFPQYPSSDREDLSPHHHQPAPHPAPALTPPVSPPHSTADSSLTMITKRENFESMINNNQAIDSKDDSYETGLDLTVKKEPKSNENEVTTTASQGEPPPAEEQLYHGHHLIAPSFPYNLPTLPFLTRMPLAPLPHHNPSFTEHLFKLATISRPQTLPTQPSPNQAQDLTKQNVVSTHRTVLSAMLGGPTQPAAPVSGSRIPVQGPVFPVFPGGIPASMFPQHPLPQSAEERPLSPSPCLMASTAVPGLESKPFRCTFCPKEFGHLSSLESHVERLHTNESKHHCEACGKAFSSKSNLTAHRKIHSGERPFECAVCYKKFRQKAHLQKHETTHSSATPYQCPHCDKAFGHPSNLNTHIATHSDVRPYECSDCGKAYKDSASFKRHRMVHTGERPYPCVLCTESFIDSKSLRRHREMFHPTALPDPELDHFDEEEEEYIEPGQEEEYHYLPAVDYEGPHGTEAAEEEDEADDEGVAADESVQQDDADSTEGDLEIAEISADSGINSSLDISSQ